MLVPLFVILAAVGSEPPPVVVEGQKPAEKRVCRTERSTGSRVVKQVCKTASEQARDELEAKNKLRLGGNQSNRPPDAFKSPTGN
ncbi:MAG: hypothetical protein HOP96_00675 [Sphingomonas sp.]|nr:hypothetical protein [Sphingomonas sp.]